MKRCTECGYTRAWKLADGRFKHLLEKSDQALKRGLVSNTYSSFGELLKWMLLAFDLDYRNKDKVESFDTFFEFVVNEYAMNRAVSRPVALMLPVAAGVQGRRGRGW